jgi:penicillin-binding protein-related factor A (putative recombinase)
VERVLADAPGVKLFRIPVKWVPREGGRRGAFPAKGAPVDFVGVVSGVGVAVECKEVARGARLSLRPERFPEAEVAALREFERRGGGLSFVAAAFWGEGVLAVVPFGKLEPLFRERAASVPLERLKEMGTAFRVSEAARIPAALEAYCRVG